LLIASLPLFVPHFWEKNRNKLVVGLVASAPVVVYLITGRHDGVELLFDTAREYLAFMALLGALFVISGGIYLRGTLAGSVGVNAAMIGIGALLASVIGTTGASALMIRPLLRANERRRYVRHIVVFFIFTVSNGGGLLTPLGDPPLFLGFLRGVPFGWTLRLAAPWLLVNGALLAMFIVFELLIQRRERAEGTLHAVPAAERVPLAIDGGLNAVWLLGILLTVFLVGSYGPTGEHGPLLRSLIQIVAMVTLAGLSLKTTAKRVHEENRFGWAPIVEVAVVFVGVFLTMVPALAFLQERGAALGVTKPWQFFWASGALSSVLDNAPTYLTFASLATGVADAGAGILSAANLGALAAHPAGAELLGAVSCGSVFMGAVTYIGNGPNFMVKAIAEQHHVRMPSFFGYVVWSFGILVPLFVVVSLVFF
jgi:Na+/H+ antiporter NhaD/arsenite permease-like protein